jgi:hypothetical protein
MKGRTDTKTVEKKTQINLCFALNPKGVKGGITGRLPQLTLTAKTGFL